MLKKNAPRVTVILALAAAFAIALAQFPWETSPDGSYESGSNPPESPEGESSFGDPNYRDIGSFSSVSDSEEGAAADNGAASKQKKAKEKTAKAKTPKERATPKDKPQRADRHRNAGPSFSAAFSGPQKSCPVCTSVRLKGNQYVDYGGGRIHVCSESCISRVRRNPDKFADVLVKRGEQVSTAK